MLRIPKTLRDVLLGTLYGVLVVATLAADAEVIASDTESGDGTASVSVADIAALIGGGA